MSPTFAHLSASLAATARWTPHVSRTPVYSVVFLTHASTAYAIGARQLWQVRARGSRSGHDSIPLCRAYATTCEPLDATDHASTARSPSAIGAWSSAIKLGPRLP